MSEREEILCGAGVSSPDRDSREEEREELMRLVSPEMPRMIRIGMVVAITKGAERIIVRARAVLLLFL